MIPARFAGDRMKRFVEGTDRVQSTLFPECPEDWIGEDNPVRVIDVFVDELDLAELGFSGVDPEATGRPSYHPSVLLKLYIYGYLNRVQSSRRNPKGDATMTYTLHTHAQPVAVRGPLSEARVHSSRLRMEPLKQRLQFQRRPLPPVGHQGRSLIALPIDQPALDGRPAGP